MKKPKRTKHNRTNGLHTQCREHDFISLQGYQTSDLLVKVDNEVEPLIDMLSPIKEAWFICNLALCTAFLDLKIIDIDDIKN